MATIHVDEDVLEALRGLAGSSAQTPNEIVRRLLDLDHATSPTNSGPKQPVGPVGPPWRPRRAVTPKSAYENYLLYVLGRKFQGRASKREATEAALRLMAKKGLLLPSAGEVLASNGETKAENAIAWSRNVLKEAGLVRPDTPRGIWELTATGLERSRDPSLLTLARR